jgi:molybdopterin-binding protein
VRVGFEVRAELALSGGEPLTALLTRDAADTLELEAGQIVWVRPDRVRALAT